MISFSYVLHYIISCHFLYFLFFIMICLLMYILAVVGVYAYHILGQRVTRDRHAYIPLVREAPIKPPRSHAFFLYKVPHHPPEIA